MTLDYGQEYFAHDTVDGHIPVSNQGVTTDEDGSTVVEWDSVLTVTKSSLPDAHADFFDADTFYRFEDVVVTKSIEQTYHVGDEEYVFTKPHDELEKAAWSLDNSPFTIDHPAMGMVRDTDDVHGFWTDGSHDRDANETTSTLFVPTDDLVAKAHIDQHGGVSVGFSNRLVEADESGIDGYQTEILFDHVAAVENGRCSNEDGCGFDTSSDSNPVRNRLMASDEVADNLFNTHNISDMCNDDKNCGCSNDSGAMFDLSDMTTDAIASRHDGVEELTDERDILQERASALESQLDSLREAMDVDEDDSLVDTAESLVDEREDLVEFKESIDSERRDETVTRIVEHMDYEEEDLEEKSLDALEQIEDVGEKAGAFETDTDEAEEESTPTTVTGDGESGGGEVTFDEKDLYDVQY